MKYVAIHYYVDENGVSIDAEEVKQDYQKIKQLAKNVAQQELTTWIRRTILVRRIPENGRQLEIDFGTTGRDEGD